MRAPQLGPAPQVAAPRSLTHCEERDYPFPATQALLGEPLVPEGRLGFNSQKSWIIPGVADKDFSVNVQFLFPCFLCPWFKIKLLCSRLCLCVIPDPGILRAG